MDPFHPVPQDDFGVDRMKHPIHANHPVLGSSLILGLILGSILGLILGLILRMVVRKILKKKKNGKKNRPNGMDFLNPEVEKPLTPIFEPNRS